MAERRHKLINADAGSTPAWADITGKPDTATRWPAWNELTGITGTPSASTYLRGDGSWATLPAGVTDHGALTGLGDDDHTQYHNDARGDARYVGLTGDQTIAGTKGFSSPLRVLSDSPTTGLLLGSNSQAKLGVGQTQRFVFYSEVNDATTENGWLFRSTNNGSGLGDRLRLDHNGDLWFGGTLTGGTVPWARLSGVPAGATYDGSDAVKLTGTQTIAGEKTFVNQIFMDKTGDIYIRFRDGAGSNRGYLYVDTSNRMGFLTSAGGWRWRVTDAGILDVGTVPQARFGSLSRLQSDGLSTSWGVTSGVNTGGFNTVMGTSSSATWLWSGTSNGNFRAGFQCLDGSFEGRLYVGPYSFGFNSSGFTSHANVTAYSDLRLKENIETIPGALDKVGLMRGVYYTRKDDDTQRRKVGVIAQEVREVLPEVVFDNGETLSVDYGNIVGLLIEAVKELGSKVDRLEGRAVN